MSALPTEYSLTNPNTSGTVKSWLLGLRSFLAGLLGTDGTAVTARATLGAAASGANNDITSLAGLTTPLSAAQGGSGQATLAAAAQDYLDTISATHGTILYRDAADWAALAPGSAGQVLQTQGAGATPAWGAATSYPISMANGGTGATSADAAADNLSLVKRNHGHNAVGIFAYVEMSNVYTYPYTPTVGGTLPGSLFQSPSGLSGTWRCMFDFQGAGWYWSGHGIAQRIA